MHILNKSFKYQKTILDIIIVLNIRLTAKKERDVVVYSNSHKSNCAQSFNSNCVSRIVIISICKMIMLLLLKLKNFNFQEVRLIIHHYSLLLLIICCLK